MTMMNVMCRVFKSGILGLVLMACGVSLSARAAQTNVSIGSFFFSPDTVAINVNDSVKWTWVGGFHSTTSGSSPDADGLWDSGVIGSGSFTNVFTCGGTFPYFCIPHSSFMTGSVIVSNQLPTVTITNPPDNSVFNDPASFTLAASASDPDGTISQVEFFRDTTSLGIDTTSPYSIAVTGLAAGTYTFSAVATDNACGKATNTITVIVNAVNALPSVTITNPPNNSVFAPPASFTLAASATDSDGTISQVEFFCGTTSLGIVTNNPYSVAVTNLTADTYTFSAVATDNAGGSATNSISVIVKVLPTVSITNPTSGATFAAPWTGTLQATAADSGGSVTNVEFFGNSISLGSVTSAPFDLTVSNVAAGTFTVIAVVKDDQGDTNTSSAVTVSVVTPVPIILGSPVLLSDTQFRFTYTANVGLRYVVERSVSLPNFAAINTNTAAASIVTFTDSEAAYTNFYRVGRLPNP